MKRLVCLLVLVLLAGGVPGLPSAAADDPAAGSVAGVVTGDPAAVEGAVVSLYKGLGEEVRRSVPVGSDGTYRFDDVAPDQYSVRVAGEGRTWTPDFQSTSVFPGALSRNITVTAGGVAAAPEQRIFMTEDVGHIDIVEPGSNGGAISVWAADDPDSAVLESGITTDGDISDLPLAPGSYKIHGASSGWIGGRSFDSAMVYTIRPGETRKVRMPSVQSIVIMRGYAPLEGVRVLAYAADDPTEVLDQAVTSYSGSYYLYDLSPGKRYKLRGIDPSGRLRSTWAGGKNFHSATPVKTADGFADLPYIDMKRLDGAPPFESPQGLTVKGAIKGTVSGPGLDPDRSGLQLVDAVHEEVERYDTSFSNDLTYAFESVSPGDYKMHLGGGEWVGGRSFASAKVFHVESGETLTQDVEIQSSGHMKARVRNHNGRPIPGLMIEVHTATGPDEIVARETPGAYDEYLFTRLPVRPYKFRIVDATGRYADAWAGGGTSMATAPSFTPVDHRDSYRWTFLPETYLRPVLRPMLAPTIGETASYGHTLTAKSSGTWSMSGLTFRRQWLRDGSRISGQTGSRYRLRSADVGRNVSFEITASKAGQPTRIAESRVLAIKPASARMRLTPGMRRDSSNLRVRISAAGISAAKIRGAVRVRDSSGSSRVVKATMRRGSATLSLRRIKNGRRTLEVTFQGPAWLTVPKGRVDLKVR